MHDVSADKVNKWPLLEQFSISFVGKTFCCINVKLPLCYHVQVSMLHQRSIDATKL